MYQQLINYPNLQHQKLAKKYEKNKLLKMYSYAAYKSAVNKLNK